MKKKYIAAIAFILVFITLFAACSEYDDYRILVDKEGNTHLLATDENGETMQDEYGNLIEVLTDENGKEIKNSDGEGVTQGVTYPNLIQSDNLVQNEYFKVNVNEGWTQTGTIGIIIKNDTNSAQYDLNVKEGKTVEDVLYGYNMMVTGLKEADAIKECTAETKKITLGKIEMQKMTIKYSLYPEYVSEEDPENQIMYVYIHGDSEKTYDFCATVLPEDDDKVDFDKLISEIEYK